MTKVIAAAKTAPTKAEKQAGRAETHASSEDFVLLCPSPVDSVLAQAALYFLPSNYKLRVLIETFQDIMPLSDDQSIVDRISFGSKSELDAAGAHYAVLYGADQAPQPDSSLPRIIISKQIQPPLVLDHTGAYSVAPNSPEALASAMLRIARQLSQA